MFYWQPINKTQDSEPRACPENKKRRIQILRKKIII